MTWQAQTGGLLVSCSHLRKSFRPHTLYGLPLKPYYAASVPGDGTPCRLSSANPKTFLVPETKTLLLLPHLRNSTRGPGPHTHLQKISAAEFCPTPRPPHGQISSSTAACVTSIGGSFREVRSPPQYVFWRLDSASGVGSRFPEESGKRDLVVFLRHWTGRMFRVLALTSRLSAAGTEENSSQPPGTWV